MRTVTSGRFTKVQVLDEPGSGGACHRYEVCTASEPWDVFARIVFQKGPIGENGVNGLHNEDLLAIVFDRLSGFQSGEFACGENYQAMIKIQEAMHWLNHRTAERQQRGVEGTSQP